MFGTLRLLLPALIPSWNFFDVIAASPRVEYALGPTPDASETAGWREFRPRPQSLSLPAMLGRLVWNPRWNESLFVTSCAERLIDHPTAHSEDEIFRRLAADLAHAPDAPWLSFRVVLLSEGAHGLTREIAYVAEPRRLDAAPRP